MVVVVGVLLIVFYVCSMVSYYLYGKVKLDKLALSFARELFLGFLGVSVCLFILVLYFFLDPEV